ncbi:MAG: hypothetical protein MJ169_06310 [Treponema sp.]|nr:hypothetical protein [Treponema sp.]
MKPVKKIPVILFSLLFTWIFTSCVSMAFYDTASIDRALRSGEYDAAGKIIDDNLEFMYSEREEVLLYLDRGLLYHYNGEFEKSNEYLSKAEKLIENNFTKSISQQIGSALINDNVITYPGEFYEDIYTNIFMCLNYIQLGQMENAMVEIRRFDNKMKFAGKEYQDLILSSRSSLESNSEYSDCVYPDLEVEFHNSALARYLSLLLYKADGQTDAALIDYKKLVNAFAVQPKVYKFSRPEIIDQELVDRSKYARINIISFTGLCPVKYEETVRVPLRSFYYKLAVPKMMSRDSQVNAIQVRAVNEQTGNSYAANLKTIEDIDAVAKDTFSQHYNAIYGRTLLRSLSKATTGAVLKGAANNASSSQGRFILGFASLINDVATEVTEQADIRSCRYFPGLANIAAVNVPAGRYTIYVDYYNGRGEKIHSNVMTGISVQQNKLNLIEDVYLN